MVLFIFFAISLFINPADVQAKEIEKMGLLDRINLFFKKEKKEEKSSSEGKSMFEYMDVSKNKKVPDYDYDVKEIEEAVDSAARATGVRKDFIMGMLVVESDLGRNIGKCTYGQVEKEARDAYRSGRLSNRAWNTFQERREIFRDIAEGAGYDYKKLKVSCSPSNYVGTGGAMGMAQFMPDTWMEYRDRISKMTGNRNPDPWNPKDAAMAMALKLSDVPGVKNHNYYAEKNAAKLYLSGTTSWKYNWYANKILYWANHYKNLMG